MPDTIRLLHITDTHLHAHGEARMRGVNTYETLQAVIARVQRGKRAPDAVLATGDLVQDETRQGYERFRDATQGLKAPIHCIPGNHDSQRIMAEVLDAEPFHYCGHALYGNWCIVMLNSVVRHDDAGLLADSELLRLDQVAEQHPDHHLMVCLHHHPFPMNSQWLDGVNLRNGEELFAVTDRHKHVRSIVWGHVHQASDRERNGVRLISTPSTGSQFLPESDVFRLDTLPPGYRWIDLHPDGTIDTEVIWLS